MPNDHSATDSALGYMYQFKYALVGALQRLRERGQVTVGLELLDDVTFERGAGPLEAIQIKHSIHEPAILTDASPQIWKTLLNWIEARRDGLLEDDADLYLVTTSVAIDGTAAWCLTRPHADTPAATARLTTTAVKSNAVHGNRVAYDAFLALSPAERLRLLASVTIIDGAKNIVEIQATLESELRIARPSRVEALAEYVEGWWYTRVVKALYEHTPINGDEIPQQVDYVVRQLADDSLPIGPAPETPPFDGYKDAMFVRQLTLIELEEAGLLQSVRDYFRAFTLRSQWQRLDLIGVGELADYERRLTEEWAIRFRWMERDLGPAATEEAMQKQASILYQWVERECIEWIRPNCRDRAIVRGSYQMLSDNMSVGWHAKFRERLSQVIEEAVEA